MNLIYHTGIISFIVQIITGLVDLYVVMLPVSGHYVFVQKLLWLELFVQLIEGSFYLWLITQFSQQKSITEYRYFDWILTTPTMLFSYCMYLIYESNHETVFEKAITDNLFIFTIIAALNALMLFFGYIAERGVLDFVTGALLGFVPFFIMFYLIYDYFAKETDIGRITFIYFSGVWALYGVASVLSYTYKNAMYNILDLFSKNFFGMFLAGVLLMQ
jgi:bacteriorhodopsin